MFRPVSTFLALAAVLLPALPCAAQTTHAGGQADGAHYPELAASVLVWLAWILLLIAWIIMVGIIGIRKGHSPIACGLLAALPVAGVLGLSLARAIVGDNGAMALIGAIPLALLSLAALGLGLLAPAWIISQTDAEVKRELAQLREGSSDRDSDRPRA